MRGFYGGKKKRDFRDENPRTEQKDGHGALASLKFASKARGGGGQREERKALCAANCRPQG